MLINAKVQKAKKSKEISQKGIKVVEKNCRLKPLSSTLKSVNSLVSTTSEREKESQRSPEFLGRNYSHCESSKTQNCTNDILGKKFSVQLSRENSQRLYTDTKNMTQISVQNALKAKNQEVQPYQKQILKWLPIKSADKTRKTTATTAASHPISNNNILVKEDIMTSFDSKNKGNLEIANVERALTMSLCSDLRSFLKSTLKPENIKRPETHVAHSASINKKRTDGKKGSSMPNSPKGVATTLSRMTEAELQQLRKSKEKSCTKKSEKIEEYLKVGKQEERTSEFHEGALEVEHFLKVPNNSLILDENELKNLLNNPNIQTSSSFRPAHMMAFLKNDKIFSRKFSSSLLHENIREEALLSLLERKFSSDQVLVNKANKYIKSKVVKRKPKGKQTSNSEKSPIFEQEETKDQVQELANNKGVANREERSDKQASGDKDLMNSLFALKDRFKIALEKLKRKLDKNKEIHVSLKGSNK